MVTLLDIPCIEADSVDIIEILRAPEMLPLTGREETFSAQGYICVTKRDNRQLVHAALYVKEIQRSLIFADSETAEKDAGRKKCEEFLALMGFRLEPINLKFSSAMRGVILREIPVILSPEVAQKNLREKKKALAEWRRLVKEPDQTTSGPELSMAEWTQRKQAQDTLAAAKKAAADNLAAEEKLAKKIATLREIIDGFLGQGNAGEITGADRSDREDFDLLSEKQEKKGDLEKRILQLEEELAAGKAERNQLHQEKKLAGVLLAESRQQLAQSESAREREAEERKISDLARKDAEKRFQALHETARRMHEQLAIGKAERDRLLKDKETADQLVAQMQQEVPQTGEATRTEAPRQQTSDEDIVRELAAAAAEELRLARKQIAAGETERLQLTRALEIMGKRSAEMPDGPAMTAPVSGKNDERIRQMQIDLRQAAERSEILRLEIESLAAGKTAAEKRLAEMAATGSTPTAVPASRLKPVDSDTSPHMVRRPPPPDALFHVDWDLAGVPYNSPEEIREVHQTMNRVRLSLEGYPDQYCSASLIITEIDGKKGIFIAFRLSSSNRVLVYVPISLPDTPKAFAAMLKEAEKFIQVVGLDIEPVQLSKNPEQRAKTLESISVLQHP